MVLLSNSCWPEEQSMDRQGRGGARQASTARSTLALAAATRGRLRANIKRTPSFWLHFQAVWHQPPVSIYSVGLNVNFYQLGIGENLDEHGKGPTGGWFPKHLFLQCADVMEINPKGEFHSKKWDALPQGKSHQHIAPSCPVAATWHGPGKSKFGHELYTLVRMETTSQKPRWASAAKEACSVWMLHIPLAYSYSKAGMLIDGNFT